MSAPSRAAEIVVADIGGTHARFAVARVGGGAAHLGPVTVMPTAAHVSLTTAWEAFAAAAGRPLPRAAAIAVACPTGGEVLALTNNPWVIRPALLAGQLGLDAAMLVNDFVAVGHAVAVAGGDLLSPVCGPDAWPARGVVSIVGPGTGLGVAQLLAGDDGYRVVATEGGHVDFAPLDAIEDAVLARLRARFGRVSVERIASGPGLVDLYATLAAIEGRAVHTLDAPALWAAALAGDDSLAAAALDRFCRCLGAVAGDVALTQGADAVVVAGGVGLRLANHLPQSGFAARFAAKGRFAARMAALPVRLLTHPQPGLFGAAAAYLQAHGAADGHHTVMSPP